MSISSAISAAATLALLLASARVSEAQQTASPANSWELRVSSGELVPTGNQRNALQAGQLTAAQLSWLVRPSLAITGTFGWARSRDLGSADTPKLDVFTSDLGIELRPAAWHPDGAVSFSPFVGMGAGARSYNYRSMNVDATNNLAGYGALGGEVGINRVALRLEVRDYATGFRPLVGGGASDRRNDVVIMAAVGFSRHRATQDQ